MSNLTGYDTGEVLEPVTWSTSSNPDDLGKVDFDNDESATVASLRIVKDPEREDHYVIEIDTYDNSFTLKEMS